MRRGPLVSALALIALPGPVGAASAADELWVKAAMVDPDTPVARYLPEEAARARVTYEPAAEADVAAVSDFTATLITGVSRNGTFERSALSQAFISQGSFGVTGPGQLTGRMMDFDQLHTNLATCRSAAPESLGRNGAIAYLIVRLDCPGIPADWQHGVAAFSVRDGSVTRVVLNIGDLPNVLVVAGPGQGRQH